jgi:hypothetical protein
MVLYQLILLFSALQRFRFREITPKVGQDFGDDPVAFANGRAVISGPLDTLLVKLRFMYYPFMLISERFDHSTSQRI